MKLSLPQQDVYFEQLLYPDEPIYNIGAKIAIQGKLSVELLQEAYVALIDQHDSYRFIIDKKEDEVMLKVLEKHDTVLPLIDFSKEENSDEKANEFMQKRFMRPFDLQAKSVLHCFVLIRVNPTFHYLFSVYHHIITDGWGTSLMFQRLVRNYNELLEHGEIQTEYPQSYKDFVEDDAAYFNSEQYLSDKEYWKNRFADLPERLLYKHDENINANKSSRKELFIKRSDYDLLAVKAKECKCSTFHMILGALYLYFSRKHGNKDFAIGLPVLNRGKSVFKKTVGLFMGVSALRIQLDFAQTFAELVQDIRQQLRYDYRHQRFPLGKLIQELEVYREKDRLFNISLSYEKQNYADHFKDTYTQVIPLSHQSERVALALYVREFDAEEDVKIDFDYNLNYFSETEITQVVEHVNKLITAIIENPNKRLADFEYLTESEKNNLLVRFNLTEFKNPVNSTILDLFKERVNKQADKRAVFDNTREYTYQDLDEHSDNLAHYLNSVCPQYSQKPLAVLMNRSADLLVALLGVLKTGRGFIPLDPAFPKERIQYILEHSKTDYIISSVEFADMIEVKEKFLDFNKLISEGAKISNSNLLNPKSSDTAYVIYTSGSTGQPKGVEIGHEALLNFLCSIERWPGILQDDLLFSVTTQSFDISILEFFAPLISGASVYIAESNLLDQPLATIEKLKDLNPSIIQATPSFYQFLFNAGWQGDKQLKVLCGGDLLSESLAAKLLDSCDEVWNMYGPTETTIWSSCKQLFDPIDASNIGKPLHNTTFFVLDESLNLLPVGSAGNIYIGGKGLAKGYFLDSEQTQEKFIDSPFDQQATIYNTGDIGKWTEAGEIEFLGRNDHQVKIRGYRIELCEIETKLNEIEGIKSSVVVAKKKTEQETLLMAFILFENEVLSDNVIHDALRLQLPEYMLPYVIIPIDEFPLTPNKKVDRKTLSQFEIKSEELVSAKDEPVTVLEKEIAKFFQKVLETEETVYLSDNFFALGGHSLNAVKLINEINRELNYQISLRNVFDNPTVAKLALHLAIEGVQKAYLIKQAPLQKDYPLTKAQYSIWLAAQQPERSIAYNMPAVFELEGEINEELLERALTDIVMKYAVLRTNFVEIAGVPRQKIKTPEEISVKLESIEINEEINTISDFINSVFNLENDLLLKVAILKKEGKPVYLIFCTHHIIIDGWSLDILQRELVENYLLLTKNQTLTLSEKEIQYTDFVLWDEEHRKNLPEANESFWNDYLKNFNWKNHIPFDLDNYENQNRGATRNFTFEDIPLNELNAFTKKYDVSLHTLLIGVFNLMLYRVFNQKDICVGTLNSGRAIPVLQDQLGMFVNTVPLRTQIDEEWSVLELLQNTHDNLLQIDRFQYLPDSLMSTMRSDILLTLINPSVDFSQIDLGDSLRLKLIPQEIAYSRLPLLVFFAVADNKIKCIIDYNPDCYEVTTIELIQLKFEKILEEIIKQPTEVLKAIDIDLLSEQSKTIDIDFNF